MSFTDAKRKETRNSEKFETGLRHLNRFYPATRRKKKRPNLFRFGLSSSGGGKTEADEKLERVFEMPL
jgi:hypothetical protein